MASADEGLRARPTIGDAEHDRAAGAVREAHGGLGDVSLGLLGQALVLLELQGLALELRRGSPAVELGQDPRDVDGHHPLAGSFAGV